MDSEPLTMPWVAPTAIHAVMLLSAEPLGARMVRFLLARGVFEEAGARTRLAFAATRPAGLAIVTSEERLRCWGKPVGGFPGDVLGLIQMVRNRANILKI